MNISKPISRLIQWIRWWFDGLWRSKGCTATDTVEIILIVVSHQLGADVGSITWIGAVSFCLASSGFGGPAPSIGSSAPCPTLSVFASDSCFFSDHIVKYLFYPSEEFVIVGVVSLSLSHVHVLESECDAEEAGHNENQSHGLNW